MKNYIIKSNGYAPAFDAMTDAFESLFKPIFYDEKLDSMRTDIKEVEGGYELEVEMPGYEKENINIALEDGYLTISAERKDTVSSDENKKRYLRKERSVSCQRSYYVGDIEESDVKANYSNGVLCVSLPKKEAQKPQKHTISIQ